MMDTRTLLRFEEEIKNIYNTVAFDTVFVAKDIGANGNILRKMWQEGVLIRVGKSGKSMTYKLSSRLRPQIEVMIYGEVIADGDINAEATSEV
jgi:hypothetical protein